MNCALPAYSPAFQVDAIDVKLTNIIYIKRKKKEHNEVPQIYDERLLLDVGHNEIYSSCAGLLLRLDSTRSCVTRVVLVFHFLTSV